MGQINTNNYPTVNSLSDADLLIVENATNGTGTTTPKQLRENAIGTDTLQTSAQTVTGAINELKGEIDAGAGVVCYDVDTITSGYLGGQFSGSANLLLLHLTTDGTADATNGYMMMLSYSRPVARFAYGRLVDADGVAYKQDVYADNTIICKISNSGEGTESDPEQVVILGIINAGFMLTPTAVVSDRDIIDGQGNTLSVLAEALTKTASGNPVVIDDCAGGKARSLITEINAIQDLHGYDHPWVGGAGKNKLAMTVDNIKSWNGGASSWSGNSKVISGITWTIITDSADNVTGIKANGTALATSLLQISDTMSFTEGDKINGASGGSSDTYGIGASGVGMVQTDSDYTVTAAFASADKYIYCRVNNGVTVSDKMFYPMLRDPSESATFAPYSNICPISGHTSVTVDDVGKNLTEDKISGCNLMSNGGIITDSTFDMQIAKVKQGETYVITTDDTSGAVYGFFTSKPVQGSTSYNGTRYVTAVKTFTAPITGYVAYRTFANYATPQCEIGTTPTPYQPYAHSSATIQLGQTVYGADINWDTGEVQITVVKYVFDGGEADTWNSVATNVIAKTMNGVICDNTKQPFCNLYNVAFTTTWNNIPDMTLWIYTTATDTYIRVRDDINGATAQSFKSFLASNNLELVLPLATPQTIQLTPEQLEMLKGYNRVSIEDGSIELGYIAKLT